MSTKSDQREVRYSVIRSGIKMSSCHLVTVCMSRQLVKEFGSRGRSAWIIEIRFFDDC